MQTTTESRDLDHTQPIDTKGLKRLTICNAKDPQRARADRLPLNPTPELLAAAMNGAKIRGWIPVLVGHYEVEAPVAEPMPAAEPALRVAGFDLDDLLPASRRPTLTSEQADSIARASMGTPSLPVNAVAVRTLAANLAPVDSDVDRAERSTRLTAAVRSDVQWSTLNDAAQLVAQRGPTYATALAEGDCEVWYARSSRDLGMGYDFCKEHGLLPKAGKLTDTHVLLGKVDADANMSRIFEALQGECWSPNGEARSLIRKLELSHTSMSVGDVIVIADRDGRRTFMVDGNGFAELEPETFAAAKAAGSRGWSQEGAARASADAALAASVGIALPPPVYALGSLLRSDGVERASELRREFEALPDAVGELRRLKQVVDAEDRQDLPARLAEVQMTGKLMFRVPGQDGHEDVRFERGALRKMCSRLKAELNMGDDLGVVGLVSQPEKELREAGVAVWNRCRVALGQREDAALPVGNKPPEQCRLVIRTRVSDRSGKPERQAFALVSEDYGEVDVNRIADACLKIKGIAGMKCSSNYNPGNNKLALDLLTHTNVPPSKQVAGETFRAGVRITTRDDGGAGLRVRAFVIRNLCLNVMIVHAGEGASQTIRHIGESWKLAKRLNDAVAAALKVVDKFRVQWDDAATRTLLSRVEPADRAEKQKMDALVQELAAAHAAQRTAEHERLGRELLGGVYRGLLVDSDLAGKRQADELVTELLAAHWDPANVSAARPTSAADSTVASVANGLTLWGQSQSPDRANDVEVLAGTIVAGIAPIVWRGAA